MIFRETGRDRGEEGEGSEDREREGEKGINVRSIELLPPIFASTGDQSNNLGLCPDQELVYGT